MSCCPTMSALTGITGTVATRALAGMRAWRRKYPPAPTASTRTTTIADDFTLPIQKLPPIGIHAQESRCSAILNARTPYADDFNADGTFPPIGRPGRLPLLPHNPVTKT